MEKEEIELASDKSASDIEITVEELLDVFRQEDLSKKSIGN